MGHRVAAVVMPLMVLALGVFAEPGGTRAEDFGLRGRVAELEEKCTVERRVTRTTLAAFDTSGNLLQETIRGRDNKVESEWERIETATGATVSYREYWGKTLNYAENSELDQRGSLLSRTRRWPGGDRHSWEYDYDARHRITVARFSTNNRANTTTWVFTYESNGRLGSVRSHDNDERLLGTRTFKYDGSGILIEETATRHDPSGELLGRTRYVYDHRGRVVAEVHTTSGQSFEARQVYEYDQQDRIVFQTRYDTYDEVFESQRYGYDTSGELTLDARRMTGIESGQQIQNAYRDDRMISRIVRDLAGVILTWQTWVYNDHGDLTEETACNPDGSLATKWRYEHEYDTGGNWIVQRHFFTDNAAEEYDTLREVRSRRVSYH